MTKLKLSIIVPIYNIEKELPSCLDSILRQDFTDYQLILINDGSNDGSGEICDHYASKDNRIEVFHQSNSGVSAARNVGLDKARGEWICFVDGDDALNPNSLSGVIAQSESLKSEMIIARSFIYESGQLTTERYGFDKSFLNQVFNGYKVISEKGYKRGSVCGCIFKNSFLKTYEIKFPLGLSIGEDSIFMLLVQLYVQQISFVDQTFYLVNKREGSASRSWSFERLCKMKDNMDFLNSYIENQKDLSEEQKGILHYGIYGIVSSIFNHLPACFSAKNYLKIIKILRKELNGKLDTAIIPLSREKIKLLNFSLVCFSFSVLINQQFRKFSE